MFKVKNGITPPLLEEIFQMANPNYNLSNKTGSKSHNVKRISFDSESLPFLGLKTWGKLPVYLKSLNSLDKFKQIIKNWVPQDCPCRLCKNYIHHFYHVT